jgi:hypothetical protein
MRARIQLTIQTADNGKRCGRACPHSYYTSAGSRRCGIFGNMAEDRIDVRVRDPQCIKAEKAMKGKAAVPKEPPPPPPPKPTAWDRLGNDDETIEDPR